jgi:short-subunit dehydrogenase
MADEENRSMRSKPIVITGASDGMGAAPGRAAIGRARARRGWAR